MNKIWFILPFISIPVFADISSRLNITTIDGTVSNWPYKLMCTNGSLTDNGDGTMTLATGGGGGSTTLISSGVAFGSNTNKVTQDTHTFVFNDTTFNLHIGTNPYSSGYTDLAPGMTIWNSQFGQVSAGVRVWDLQSTQTEPIISVLDPTLGNVPYNHEFTIFHELSGGNDLVIFGTGAGSGGAGTFKFGGEGGQNYVTMDNTGLNVTTGINASSYTFRNLSASQFIQTNGSKNASSYDLFNASPTYNGQANWTSASPSTFTIIAVTTINFTGSGNGFLTEPNGLSGQIVLSTTVSPTPVVGNCSMWLSSTTLGDAGAACGTGGGSGSGTVTASPQYQVAAFTQSGSSNVVAGYSNLTNNGSTVTVSGITNMTENSVSTVTATGVLFNYSSSSQTISSMTIVGPLKVLNSPASQYDTIIGTSPTAGIYHVAISSSGHYLTGGSTPTISSCGSTPNGSVIGNDQDGQITIGGGSVTGCILTFAQTYGAGCIVACTISDNITTTTPDVSTTPTTMTLGFSASIGGGVVNYHCVGVTSGCL